MQPGILGFAPFTDTGTYTVNPDCTGAATLTNLGLHLNIVIVSGGTEILAIQGYMHHYQEDGEPTCSGKGKRK